MSGHELLFTAHAEALRYVLHVDLDPKVDPQRWSTDYTIDLTVF